MSENIKILLLGDSALTRGLAHRLSDREDTEVYANFDVEGVIKADLEPMDFGDTYCFRAAARLSPPAYATICSIV